MTASDEAPIRPERLMAELDRRLTGDAIVVADASYASVWTVNYLRSRRPGMRLATRWSSPATSMLNSPAACWLTG